MFEKAILSCLSSIATVTPGSLLSNGFTISGNENSFERLLCISSNVIPSTTGNPACFIFFFASSYSNSHEHSVYLGLQCLISYSVLLQILSQSHCHNSNLKYYIFLLLEMKFSSWLELSPEALKNSSALKLLFDVIFLSMSKTFNPLLLPIEAAFEVYLLLSSQ